MSSDMERRLQRAEQRADAAISQCKDMAKKIAELEKRLADLERRR